MKNLTRDKIDFSTTDITQLFINIFIPTLLGMISYSLLNIVDGIIVGKGVGSDALAAVNVTAPLYLITAAIGLTFGAGSSIVAAIHLSKGNEKAANIKVTQALFYPLVIMALLSIFMLTCIHELNLIFGGSELLFPLVKDYMYYLSPMPILYYFELAGLFIIRLDGSPRFAMLISIIAAVVNTYLDWLFVFPMGMGIKGAAIATTISMGTSAIMTVIYLAKFSKTIHLYRIKISRTSLYLTFRNLIEMLKVGSANFIQEISIGVMIVVGNHMFMRILNEDGVAAYSVICYLTPVLFMFGNSIAQSQLPIISFNHGINNYGRVMKTIKLSTLFAFILGCIVTLLSILSCDNIINLFLDKGTRAYQIAADGFPLFTSAICVYTLNIVIIGIYQSLESSRKSFIFTALKGIVLLVPCFILIPQIIGKNGLWLALTVSESITFVIMIIDYKKSAAKYI